MHVDTLKRKRRRALRRMRCEVRPDRRAAPRVSPARFVRCAGREHQRLPCLAPWRHARPYAPDGPAGRGLDEEHPHRGEGRLRLAAYTPRTAGPRPSHRPAPCGAPDARERHPGAAPAAPCGDDGLQALDAGGAKPAAPRLHTRGAEPGVDGRHHPHPDRRRLALHGDGCWSCSTAKSSAGRSSRG
jgi:hypothetical protein